MGVLNAYDFKAFYVEGLDCVVKSPDHEIQRKHRRALGLLLDARVKSIAVANGLELGEKYAPYDAAFYDVVAITYTDFKLVNEPKKSEYSGWQLTMHFSDNEYQFAKKNDLTFMAYRIVPNTSIAELLITFNFSEAKDRNLVQLQTIDGEVWWNIDLLAFKPDLGCKLLLT